jgi:hypothetical protein
MIWYIPAKPGRKQLVTNIAIVNIHVIRSCFHMFNVIMPIKNDTNTEAPSTGLPRIRTNEARTENIHAAITL